MKVKISQDNLNKGLSLAGRFIASRPQLPILSNFLLATDKGKLKLSATNLDLGINLWLGAVVEEKGQLLIPAREVSEFVSYLPAGEVFLESQKTSLKITSPKAEAVFGGMSAQEFPQIPQGEEKNSLLLDVTQLSKAVSQVCFAAAIDETRPVLEGVFWQFDQDGYQMVATDGYRLSLKKITSKQVVKKETSFLIPARSLLEVTKLIQEDKLKVSLDKKQSQAVFIIPRRLKAILSSRLLSGEFPDYKKIIPQQNSIQVSVDHQELLSAVKIASVFARQAGNVIVLDFKNGQLEIKADALQVGKNKTSVPIKIKGEEVKVAFNYRFLLDYLNSIDNKEAEVIVKMNDSLSPVVFTVKGDNSFLHLIMPINLEDK